MKPDPFGPYSGGGWGTECQILTTHFIAVFLLCNYVNNPCRKLVRQETALNLMIVTLYNIETPFNTFANRADPDQAAPVGAA